MAVSRQGQKCGGKIAAEFGPKPRLHRSQSNGHPFDNKLARDSSQPTRAQQQKGHREKRVSNRPQQPPYSPPIGAPEWKSLQ
jgi:hypothetical protein